MQEICCLARGLSQAVLQGMVGHMMETGYDNAKGFKTWGMVYNAATVTLSIWPERTDAHVGP